MRQIVLDTETTGLEPQRGHRIIELAALEIRDRRVTDGSFHRYLNPERESDEAALAVHGISNEFLQDKPRFREVARDFLEFVSGAELIIHNADFDVAFLDHELALAGLDPLSRYCARVTDTLRMAKELRPGKRNNLDALCEHYQVDNSGRTLHGALLDARLLADVYLAMTRGQESLMIEDEEPVAGTAEPGSGRAPRPVRVIHASVEELASHAACLEGLDRESKGKCVWKRLEAGGG
ncbi:MAG TPA: DNA polymerase III subunit epsilon [Burkholderiales bacterium]|nr:DNA polymerase III subunit epsilon [Burkholderiales bacterium]